MSSPAAPLESFEPEETTGIVALDDDDAVIVPAAPMSTLSYAAQPKAMSRVQQIVMQRKLDSRRMVVQILLTMGLIFLIIAGLGFTVPHTAEKVPVGTGPEATEIWVVPDDAISPIVDPESRLAGMLRPVWRSAVLLLMGLAMLTVGVLTALQVKKQMEETAAPMPPAQR